MRIKNIGIKFVVLFVFFFAIQGIIVFSQERPLRCAVLEFTSTEPHQSGQANLLCNRYAVLLNATENYSVIPRYQMNRTLVASGFNSKKYTNTARAALEAGKLLQVDLVIYGNLSKDGLKYELSSSLIDVHTARVIRSVRTSSENFDQFIDFASEKNMHSLMRIQPPPAEKPKPAVEVEKPMPARPEQEPVAIKHDESEIKPKTPIAKPVDVPAPVNVKAKAKITQAKENVIKNETPESLPEIAEPVISQTPSKPQADVKATEEAPIVKAAKSTTPIPAAVTEAEQERSNEIKKPLPLSNAKKPLILNDWKSNDVTEKKSFLSRSSFQELWNKSKDQARGHLEIGTRITSHHLFNPDDDSFLGSMDQLREKQNNFPVKLFANYLINDTFGVELTWDQMRTAGWTSLQTDADGNYLKGGYSDGTIRITGPILSVFARHLYNCTFKDKDLKFTPYAGVGISYMFSNFENTGWWHNGFGGSTWTDARDGYDAWVASGAPEWPNGGYRRTMSLDNAFGFVFMSGCSMALTENLDLDLYLRLMKIEVDDTYTLSRHGNVSSTRYYTWPLSHYTIGLGVKYKF